MGKGRGKGRAGMGGRGYNLGANIAYLEDSGLGGEGGEGVYMYILVVVVGRVELGLGQLVGQYCSRNMTAYNCYLQSSF